jgi:hypothetical protein
VEAADEGRTARVAEVLVGQRAASNARAMTDAVRWSHQAWRSARSTSAAAFAARSSRSNAWPRRRARRRPAAEPGQRGQPCVRQRRAAVERLERVDRAELAEHCGSAANARVGAT